MYGELKLKTNNKSTKKTIVRYKIIENNCFICTSHKYYRNTLHICLDSKQRGVPMARAIYKQYVGDITDEQRIVRTCKNSRCINPAHLKAVSNSKEMSKYYHCDKLIYKSKATKLSKKQVSEIRNKYFNKNMRSIKNLALSYSVSTYCIYDVINYATHKNVL